MRFQSPRLIKILTLSIAFFLSISCSKDSDLLADYIVSDIKLSRLLGNTVMDDYYFISNNKSIVLDVLSNDLFENPEKVKITEISTPINGTVTINEDKTLTYTVGSEAPIKEKIETPKQSDQNVAPKENATPEETVTSTGNEKPEHTDTPEQIETTEEKTSTEETDFTQETINESITYTVETENDDGTTNTQEGTVTITNDYGELKAFPTAMGYGKYTTGGRGGYVIHVTNLSDKGPGSLRQALYAEGKRTVVFDVSGYINLVNTISIRNPHITIAGQTAPGKGITLRGAGISVRASNVIVRYLRIRPGFDGFAGTDCINIRANQDNLNIDGVIIDHCSLSWSLDENLSFDGAAVYSNNSIKNATVQNCINAESFDNYAVLMGRNLGRVSLIRNLFANNNNRIPESTYGYTPESYEFNNNIIYNYNRPTTICFGVNIDVIGNLYKAKDTPSKPNLQYSINNIENPDGKATDGKIFSIDNLQIGTNPNGMYNRGWEDNNRSSRVLTDSPYQPIPSNELENTILNDVGANVFEDAVDNRIIRQYHNNEGLRGPINETQIGGFPSLTNEKHPEDYDTDRDGMADKWERENGLDPNNADDGKADKNGDGYTNLEDYLHFLTFR